MTDLNDVQKVGNQEPNVQESLRALDSSNEAIAGAQDESSEPLDYNEFIPLVDGSSIGSIENVQETKRWRHIGKRALQSLVITLQVLPTNGFLRFGPGAATYAATKDEMLSGAVVGISTLLLEGAAGLATADLQTNNPDSRVFTGIRKLLGHKKINPLIVSEEGKLLPVAEGLTALYAGTPAAMVAKESVMSESEVSKRTHEQRKRYSLKTAAILGAVCTAQGYLYSIGVSNFDDPKYVLGAGTILGASMFAQKKAAKKLKESQLDHEVAPRYDLDEKEYKILESELVSSIENEHSEEDIYTVLIKPQSKFANLIRTQEAAYFPEVKVLPTEVEKGTVFIAFVDTREDAKRIVHAATISGLDVTSRGPDSNTGHTGFTTVDQLIDMDNFRADEFFGYYTSKGIDVQSSVSVDTNFRIGEWRPGVGGISITDLAYVSIFKLVDERKKTSKYQDMDAGAFCSINQASIDSFADFGMDCELLLGREDLVTPESLEGKQYLPVFVRADHKARKLFEDLVPLVKTVQIN